VQEFKRESFEMFSAMLDSIKLEAITILTRIQVRDESQVEALEQQQQQDLQGLEMKHDKVESALATEEPVADSPEQQQPYVRKERKLGRNEPCWCGSGKKYKHCHGKLS